MASSPTRSSWTRPAQRASAAHQPNVRMIEGEPTALPLRDGAVDVVLHGLIEADDGSLPAVAEALRVLRPGGRLVVIGYYGRDDVAPLLEPEVVAHARTATQRRSGWWLRHGFKIKVVHARLDLRDDEARPRHPPPPVRRSGAGVSDVRPPAHARAETGAVPPRQAIGLGPAGASQRLQKRIGRSRQGGYHPALGGQVLLPPEPGLPLCPPPRTPTDDGLRQLPFRDRSDPVR